MYLTYFKFPDDDREIDFIWDNGLEFGSFYPFKILSARGLGRVDFEPITILYGGNGSGKTTALNVIAEKTGIERDSIFTRTKYFPAYADMCEMNILDIIPRNSRIVTSDDVFDYMLNIRSLNEGIHQRRSEVQKEYLDAKFSQFQMKSLDDYETLKKVNKTRRITQRQFTKGEVMDNVRELSNGESAYRYFTEKIGENGLYLLDEPENSLSPKHQLELKDFIENSVRFFGCQFIISTHSPFLLAMPGAKIYDLDDEQVKVKKWTELENIKIYREFFKTVRD